MNIKAAVFDLDGTLAYTLPDICTAMNRAMRSLGVREINEEKVLKEINKDTHEFVAHCLPDGSGEELCYKAWEEYMREYSVCFMDSTTAYDGMAEALDCLSGAGIRLAAYSNKSDAHVKAMIEKLFGDRFEIMMGPDNIRSKPDPEGALIIAGKFGISPSEMAFVGDSDVDILTALNAGMIPVGVSWGYREKEILVKTGASAVADTPEKLVSLLTGKEQ